MSRQCLALDLIDDPVLIAEYERLHQQIWPQISAHLRGHGVLDMQIWRLGTRLFMVMDTAPEFSAEAFAPNVLIPRTQNSEKLLPGSPLRVTPMMPGTRP